MFATFDKSNGAAEEFWTAVRDGIGFQTKDDARLVLRNALTSTSIGNGRGAQDGRKNVSSEEMYRWCIVSWNAHRASRPVRQLKANLNFERQKAS